VLVWPYGMHNEMARGAAAGVGFTATLALGGREVTADDLRLGCLPRIMVTRRFRFDASEAAWLAPPAAPVRAASVDLARVWSPDPVAFRDRVARLVQRAKALGATHVFLSVCSDTLADGRIQGAWCMNHQVAVRADVWSMVASKLAQARIKVWARVPTMNLTWVWQQHPEWRLEPAAGDGRAAGGSAPAARWATRLSPDLPEARRAAIDFLTDIAVYAPIDGVVFDDDAAIGADEPLALARTAGAADKAGAIDDLLARCSEAVRAWRPECRFARVVDRAAVERAGVDPNVSQDFARILREDDLTIVASGPPRGDAAAPAERAIERLARRAVERWSAAQAAGSVAAAGAPAIVPGAGGDTVPIAPVLIELDAWDAAGSRWLSAHGLAVLAAAARRGGVASLGLDPVTPDAGDLPDGLLESGPSPGVAGGDTLYR